MRTQKFQRGSTHCHSAKNLRKHVLMVMASATMLWGAEAHADFVNGDFEDPQGFRGWTRSGYRIPKTILNFPPLTQSDLGLTDLAGNDRSGISGSGSDSTTDNRLSWTGRVAHVHTSDHNSGMSNRGSGVEQQITIASSDVDADGKVHVRFTAAPVLESPAHEPNEQPYFFIEIVKADGTSLFSTFNFANQAGIAWQMNANQTVAFTDWQAFDIPLDPALVKAGDVITLRAIASGCGKGGHTGALYLNDVRTVNQVSGPSLWVTAEGPDAVRRHTRPDGTTDITYTYTYTNNGSVPVDNVTVKPAMPQTTDPSPRNTTFVAIGQPGTGSCTAPASANEPAVCNVGTLAPGATGSFTMTVRVPADTRADQVNNGNYPIAGTAVPLLLGPLVKTTLHADMVPDVTDLPTTVRVGALYAGRFSCVNQGSTAAHATTCAPTGLPEGVAVVACTMTPPTPAVPWSAGMDVAAAGRVTCDVEGIVTQPGPATIEVTTDATNNDDKTNNKATRQVTVTAPDMAIDLSGLPATAGVGAPYTGHFTCGNVGDADALAATTCGVTGLAPGIFMGACSISPTNAAWTAGQTVPAGETVTCEVGGSLQTGVVMNIVGKTGATGDSHPANNSATLTVAPTGATPNLRIDLTPLPRIGAVGRPYKGRIECTNAGAADAVLHTSCVAEDLPDGVTQGACTISPGNAAWVQGNAIPAGARVLCDVEGTPSKPEKKTVTGEAGPARTTADVVITAAGEALAVPTLSQWGQMLLASLVAGLAWFTLRRKI